MLGVFADLLNGWFHLHCVSTIPFLLILQLFCSPGDASLGQVVDRNLDGYSVTRQYSDIVHSELSRDMSRYYMLVGKLYLEGRVGQCLNYSTLKFDNIILWQNNPSSAIICDSRLLFWISTLTTLYL